MKTSLSIYRLSLINNLIRRHLSNESSSSMDFETAKSRLESSSSIQVDNETKLKLYALYKQATSGVCSTAKPGLTDFIGRAKWTAWSSLGKMNQQDAQKQYILTVQQLLSNSTSNNQIESTSKSEEITNEKDESTTAEHIELIKKSPLHWEIVLNRPEKYNAITQPMYERIIQILDQAAQDKELILLSFTGKGKFYSAGTDLADFAKMATSTTNLKESVERGQILLETYIGKYIDFPKILIAFINGPAVGISVSTLGLFDGVYSSSNATFSLPFTRTAQSAEGCSSFTFPLIMGSINAKDVLLFDRKLTADEAQQRGLITKVIDDKLFEDEKQKICQHILSLPKGSLLTSKLLIQKWNKEILQRVNNYEVETLKQRWLTEEFVQAMMEFMRGRKKTKSSK
ncbi:unnamed protein product [Rotaria sp. Silwood1]|nr:unnamed protein product [Rotaria sp. Silwood1]CAF1607158.1 unnamed protein product [Rotaria sp. Silwood1]